MTTGGTRGWSDFATIGSIAISIILIATFIFQQKRTTHPFLDLSIFQNSLFTAGIIILVIMGLSLNGIIYVVTYYMQFAAGIGSAINATFQRIAGAIGVSLLGAILTSVYSTSFYKSTEQIAGVPSDLIQQAGDSVGAAITIANSGLLSPEAAFNLIESAKISFMDGWRVITIVSGVVIICGFIVVLKYFPTKISE